MKRIIFPNDDGGVAVLIPVLENNYINDVGEWLFTRDQAPKGFRPVTVEDVAIKDVPAGKPFEIIDAADLPDRSTRNQWEWS